jgi:hypothetical protein
MSPLTIGISACVSLLIIASLALTIMWLVRYARDGVQRPMRDGKRLLATITDVQMKQDWKEGERWERNPWNGNLMRQKTWQTYYDMTAEWMHSQTKQKYTFRSKVWSDEVAKTPTKGHTIVFMVDLRHPERYTVDLQSLSDSGVHKK